MPYASNWCLLLLNRPCLGGIRPQLLCMWSWTSIFFITQELRLEPEGKSDSPLKTVHFQVCGTRTWVLVSDGWVYESTFATSQLRDIRWITLPPPASGSSLYYGNSACLTDVSWRCNEYHQSEWTDPEATSVGAWYSLQKRVSGVTGYLFSIIWETGRRI